MNAQKSRKFIVAGGMAAVVAIAAVMFAASSRSVAPLAQALPPPAEVGPLPAVAAAPTAPVPEAAAAVATVPDVPAPIAHRDVAGAKSAATRSVAATNPPAAKRKTDASEVASTGTISSGEPVFDSSEKLAAETVAAATVPTATAASSVDSAKSADPLATPATSSPPVADLSAIAAGQPAAASPVAAAASPVSVPATDSQITTNVKSEIAVDSVTRNTNIAVSTTDGVVALSGSLASQDAIDHAKDLVAKLKDVKSVDTTALTLANL